LEDGFFRRVEKVNQAGAQVLQPPGQAGMDRGQEIYCDENDKGNRDEPEKVELPAFAHGGIIYYFRAYEVAAIKFEILGRGANSYP
jgi:hypothetical protein